MQELIHREVVGDSIIGLGETSSNNRLTMESERGGGFSCKSSKEDRGLEESIRRLSCVRDNF